MISKKYKKYLFITAVFTCAFSIVWAYVKGGFEPYITFLGAVAILAEFIRSERKISLGELIISQKLLLQIVSALTLGVFIAWLSFEPGFATVAGLFTGILTFGISLLASDDPINLTSDIIRKIRRDKEERYKLLVTGRKIWIEDSLYKELQYLPKMPVRFANYQSQSKTKNYLNSNDNIANLSKELQRNNRRIVILGEPGVGKTIVLLQILEEMLNDCETNTAKPIPIKLSLVTWQINKKALKEWVIDELIKLHDISKIQATIWAFEDGRLTLLLDGLDELDEETKKECVKAINDFILEMHETSLIITCRTADYELLEAKPASDITIEMLPLTKPEVLSYLNSYKKIPSAILRTIKMDEGLNELITIRLFLGLLCKLKESRLLDEYFDAKKKIDKQLLLSLFVRQSLELRTTWSVNERKKHLAQLAWIAKRLNIHHSDILFVERLQYSWLGKKSQKITAYFISIFFSMFSWSLFSGILGVVAWLLAVGAIWEISFDSRILLPTGIIGIGYSMAGIVGLFFLVVQSVFTSKIEPAEKLEFSILDGLRGVLISAVLAGVLSLIFTQTTGTLFSKFVDMMTANNFSYSVNPLYFIYYFAFLAIYALVILIISCVLTVVAAKLFIKLKLISSAFSIRKVVALGAILGLSSGGFGSWIGGSVSNGQVLPVEYLNLAFLVGILSGSFSGFLIGGTSPAQHEDRFLESVNSFNQPNSGIHLSAKNSMTMAGLGLLLSIVLASLLTQPAFKVGILSELNFISFLAINIAIYGSIFAIVICPILAFSFGLFDVVNHFILRVFMRFTSNIPLNLPKFLMDMCETGLLRRVGRGFRFRHPLFQDYFSRLVETADIRN